MNKIIKNNSINLKKVSNPYIPFGVKLASVPKTPYAPFKKGDPKGHGTEMINTGFEWTMNNQASTNRANTLTYKVGNNTYNAWRGSDTYPLCVYYGSVIYNATGSAWDFQSNKYIPNGPAQQIEIACKNIEADIIAGMYTDLVITNYTPKYLNDSKYPTSIFVRYIRAAIFNSKCIISAVKKLSQLLAINEYLSNVSSLFVNRSNILITEVSRRRFIASMELLNAALKQIPIHKDVWNAYSGLWNVSFDPSKLNSPFTYVSPSVYEYSGEAYSNVQNFCTIAETSSTDAPTLIVSNTILTSITNIKDPNDFITHFLEDSDTDFRSYVTTTVDAINDLFRTLSLAIAAMSQAFQPFIVAMIRVGDKYFSDVIVRNPDIRDLIQTKFNEFKDFEVMGMLRGFTPTVTSIDNGRTVSMTVPLFNSYSPIDMFKKNGVLMCKSMDISNDPAASYKAIIDVSDLWPRNMHCWVNLTPDGTNQLFSWTVKDCATFNGKHLMLSPISADLIFDLYYMGAKTDMIHKYFDYGMMQYLQHSLATFVLKYRGTDNRIPWINPEFSGFRSVSYEPVLDQLMERAPFVFGINSELAKAIKS